MAQPIRKAKLPTKENLLHFCLANPSQASHLNEVNYLSIWNRRKCDILLRAKTDPS